MLTNEARGRRRLPRASSRFDSRRKPAFLYVLLFNDNLEAVDSYLNQDLLNAFIPKRLFDFRKHVHWGKGPLDRLDFASRLKASVRLSLLPSNSRLLKLITNTLQ